MHFERWLADRYLEGRLQLPGALVQVLLNAYLQIYYQLEPLIGRFAPVPERSDAIAAHSHELMQAHYNLPLLAFAKLLGPSMKYSMGLWEHGVRTLEEAQAAMLADVCEKADIRDGQRIINVGCGFGALAEFLLRRYPDVRVHGLTLSRTQADYLGARQSESGHPLNSDRFHLAQEDFNTATFEQPFDRIVSLGVFEHVSNIGGALYKLRRFIRDDGRCFLHYIVYRPPPMAADDPRQDAFIERYVFPGGRIYAHTELAKHQGDSRVERDWYLSGVNYRETLRAWLRNFLLHKEALRSEGGLSERQLRIWELYLRCCFAVFNTRSGRLYGNGQYLLRPV